MGLWSRSEIRLSLSVYCLHSASVTGYRLPASTTQLVLSYINAPKRKERYPLVRCTALTQGPEALREHTARWHWQR